MRIPYIKKTLSFEDFPFKILKIRFNKVYHKDMIKGNLVPLENLKRFLTLRHHIQLGIAYYRATSQVGRADNSALSIFKETHFQAGQYSMKPPPISNHQIGFCTNDLP